MTKTKPPAKPAKKTPKKAAPAAAVKPETTKPPGRPPGSPNRSYDEVTVQPSVCQQCRSAERSAYFGDPQVQDVQIEINGTFYNRCTWRRCRCEKCGQHRFDKTYSYIEPEPAPEPVTAPEPEKKRGNGIPPEQLAERYETHSAFGDPILQDVEGEDADLSGPDEE